MGGRGSSSSSRHRTQKEKQREHNALTESLGMSRIGREIISRCHFPPFVPLLSRRGNNYSLGKLVSTRFSPKMFPCICPRYPKSLGSTEEPQSGAGSSNASGGGTQGVSGAAEPRHDRSSTGSRRRGSPEGPALVPRWCWAPAQRIRHDPFSPLLFLGWEFSQPRQCSRGNMPVPGTRRLWGSLLGGPHAEDTSALRCFWGCSEQPQGRDTSASRYFWGCLEKPHAENTAAFGMPFGGGLRAASRWTYACFEAVLGLLGVSPCRGHVFFEAFLGVLRATPWHGHSCFGGAFWGASGQPQARDTFDSGYFGGALGACSPQSVLLPAPADP